MNILVRFNLDSNF